MSEPFDVIIRFESKEAATEAFCEFQNLSNGLRKASRVSNEGPALEYYAGAGVMMIDGLRKRCANLEEFEPGSPDDNETGKP